MLVQAYKSYDMISYIEPFITTSNFQGTKQPSAERL